MRSAGARYPASTDSCLTHDVPHLQRCRLRCHAGVDEERGGCGLIRGVRPRARGVLLGEGQHQCFQRLSGDGRWDMVREHALALTAS